MRAACTAAKQSNNIRALHYKKEYGGLRVESAGKAGSVIFFPVEDRHDFGPLIRRFFRGVTALRCKLFIFLT